MRMSVKAHPQHRDSLLTYELAPSRLCLITIEMHRCENCKFLLSSAFHLKKNAGFCIDLQK